MGVCTGCQKKKRLNKTNTHCNDCYIKYIQHQIVNDNVGDDYDDDKTNVVTSIDNNTPLSELSRGVNHLPEKWTRFLEKQ